MTIGYDLATDMNVSDDGMTWTVTIRDDVKFTDGEPLTAEDVAFTYNTLRDTSSVNDFTMLKEAKALDDTTVEFDLSRPYSIWPGDHRDRPGACLWTGLRFKSDRLRPLYYETVG